MEIESSPSTLDGIVVSRIELPSGGWAEFRDPREVRTRDRKRALSGVDANGPQLVMGLDMLSGLAVMLVDKWTVPYAPFGGAVFTGITFDQIDDLIPGDTDALTRACQPAQRLLFPEMPSPDNMKPGSPTQPAGD